MAKNAKERGESRAIYAALAHDPDFQRLSPRAKLSWYTLKLELGASGIDTFYKSTLSELTGIPYEEVGAVVQELEAGEWLIRDGNVWWLRNALRFDPYLTPKRDTHLTGIINHLRSLPKCEAVMSFCEYYSIPAERVGIPKDGAESREESPDNPSGDGDRVSDRVRGRVPPTGYRSQEIGGSTSSEGSSLRSSPSTDGASSGEKGVENSGDGGTDGKPRGDPSENPGELQWPDFAAWMRTTGCPEYLWQGKEPHGPKGHDDPWDESRDLDICRKLQKGGEDLEIIREVVKRVPGRIGVPPPLTMRIFWQQGRRDRWEQIKALVLRDLEENGLSASGGAQRVEVEVGKAS